MSKLKNYVNTKKKKETTTITARIPSEKYLLFKNYCEKLNLSINEAINILVDSEIEDKNEYNKKENTEYNNETNTKVNTNKSSRKETSYEYEYEELSEEEKEEIEKTNTYEDLSPEWQKIIPEPNYDFPNYSTDPNPPNLDDLEPIISPAPKPQPQPKTTKSKYR